MDVIINYTRLTTSDRLADRFLTCQVYSPQDEDSSKKGSIFTQVEILNPWFSTSQVGQSIINTLIREYYKADDTSDLNNFESAVKGVNEALAQIAQSGETDWIGKLSSVLVLVIGKEAHFAQTGQSHAYLYRGNKINHITEGLENEASPHPLKTFTNLTSGTLQEGDKIVIANPTFFEAINPDELKIIITQNNPTQAAIETAKILKGRGIKTANAIFMEATTKNELANLPPEQKQDAVYINEQLSSLTTNLKNIWRNLILPLSVSLKSYTVKTFSDSKQKLAPKIKEGISQTAATSKKLIDNARSKGASTAQKLISDKEIEEDDSEEDSNLSALSESAKLYSIRSKNKLKRFLMKIGFSKPHGPRMYLIALVGVIVILAGAIWFSTISRNNRNRDREFQNKLNQITSLEGEASTQLVANNNEGALSSYRQIVTLANELKDSKYADQANNSYQKAYSKILELTGAKEIASFDEKDVPISPSHFALANGHLSLISNDKKLFSVENGEMTDLSDKISSDISQSAGVESLIAVSTQDEKLYIVDPDTGDTTLQSVRLNYAGVLSSFFDSIYVLDPPSNQIWKITNNGGYKENQAYISGESVPLADSVDMAIDGSIYTIGNNCDIERISRGESVANFTVTLPAGDQLDSCVNIFTSEDSSDLYVIGQGAGLSRIIKLGKNGSFVSQYILKETSCDGNCFIDTSSNTFYQIQDNKLKSASL